AAATQAQPAPVAAQAPAAAPAGRGDEIRARLERIRVERQQAEDGRLGALARFDFSRVGQYQAQITALDAERTRLDQELASLPAAGAAPAPVQAPAPARPASDTDRLRCTDMMAAHDEAVRIRQKELGAKEGQAGVVPLLPLRGQSAVDVAREVAAQMPEGSGAQVGLLDADGDGRIEAFIDTPAPGTYRLYRQRPDGTLSVEVFSSAAASPAPYGEIPRRLDETAARQLGRSLPDLLAVRPAGAVRVTAETPDFAPAQAHWFAGNYAEAAKLERPAARGIEYQNLRGERVRVIEVLAPVANGLVLRQLVATPRPGDQEQWEETVTTVRPVSFWRTEVELFTGRETRAAGGAPVGTRATAAPIKFSIDR
ncbi:MAG: hypothetical protein HYV93_14145, partial [Candidatus Rokubacteria bacterium]|nr:hypothetical protein [Candidatus Rokubacteria bacterium]